MPSCGRLMPVDKQLAERPVTQYGSICTETLDQNLPAVGDKQQAGVPQTLSDALVIKCGDESLTGAGCGDNQISVASVSLALRMEML